MAVTDPDLVAALDALVDPVSRGDPESPLRWTTKSTAKLAAELTAMGRRVSARTVAKLLKQAGYSLQANSKTLEGARHPDRDAQFGYLNTEVERFQADGDPVISVDTKKKELVGNYKAAGREWEPAGSPRTVKVHDFADKTLGKVAPYGVYDIAANTGWVNVGTDADTGQFAVEFICRWWTTMRYGYPGSDKLLITADSGGSNDSSAAGPWNTELAAFAAQAGLDITVCHLPPVDLQMEQDRTPAVLRDQPQLARTTPGSDEVVIETLRATTTSTGLTVNAVLDTTTYDRGIKITDKQIASLEATQLHRHEFHGDWNYTLTADHTATRPTQPT